MRFPPSAPGQVRKTFLVLLLLVQRDREAVSKVIVVRGQGQGLPYTIQSAVMMPQKRMHLLGLLPYSRGLQARFVFRCLLKHARQPAPNFSCLVVAMQCSIVLK